METSEEEEEEEDNDDDDDESGKPGKVKIITVDKGQKCHILRGKHHQEIEYIL